jgi:predicted N-acyltransferase
MTVIDEKESLKIKVLSSLNGIKQCEWDSCACPETSDGRRPLDPFTTYRFLNALEESNSVGEDSGWLPKHIVVFKSDTIISVMPLYLKLHSQGEYIFDHSWANAYSQAGGRYYPKLQGAVPFTPVSGRRFLTKPGFEIEGSYALIRGVLELAKNNNISSIHITFCMDIETKLSKEFNFLSRDSIQFQWFNNQYLDFESFLQCLSSRKRKALKKERITAKNFGGDIVQLTGDQLELQHWDSFWNFYQDTGARKWGTPYLTRSFFDILHQNLKEDVLLVIALKNNKPIAGALNFIGKESIFGRYWGASEDHSCLHYELCYYQAIDYAIKHKLKRIEAGAQGEHKLARGYIPIITRSIHWFLNESFSDAVNNFLTEEKLIIRDQLSQLMTEVPFKKEENSK